MPGGASHKIGQHDLPSGLSDSQFEQLTAQLDDQHRVLVDLLQPIHDVAKMVLADRAPEAKPAPEQD